MITLFMKLRMRLNPLGNVDMVCLMLLDVGYKIYKGWREVRLNERVYQRNINET